MLHGGGETKPGESREKGLRYWYDSYDTCRVDHAWPCMDALPTTNLGARVHRGELKPCQSLSPLSRRDALRRLNTGHLPRSRKKISPKKEIIIEFVLTKLEAILPYYTRRSASLVFGEADRFIITSDVYSMAASVEPICQEAISEH